MPSHSPSRGRAVGFAVCIAVYIVAAGVAVLAGGLAGGGPLRVAGAADLAATVVVFVGSLLLGNSSLYDPYWSVAPPLLGAYWIATAPPGTSLTRQTVVMVLVSAWAARLTWNWARGWRGLRHEDWRYVQLHVQLGRSYWPVSFLGIHMMPTVVVFLGCLSLHRAVGATAAPLGALDIVAAAVTASAVVLEAVADAQLRRFTAAERARVAAGAEPGVMTGGVWGWSRHPNYLGEVLFWWGIFLFGMAAAPVWWLAAGPVVMTALFVFVSIPLMERHMLARRPAFADLRRRIPALVPRLLRRGGNP